MMINGLQILFILLLVSSLGVQVSRPQEQEQTIYSVASDGSVFKIPTEFADHVVETKEANGNISWSVPGFAGTVPNDNEPGIMPGIQRIIGTDDRVKVTNTTLVPFRYVVDISSSLGNCTGFLYDDNHIGTAGHCVHSGGTSGSWATNITVTPGKNASSNPFGTCGASVLITNSEWLDHGDNADLKYDYGAIKLNCNVGDTTGWFGLKSQLSS